ncbi:Beta-1,4-N-acetylgalactosaminyltransferase bre-4 [Trichinella spiralis]|uniref:Beta-1,4-N-acetylgalactosaminyltransferase bre-4 n=1 Tax=Trichinella spiralis TaxID=6334 RepID=A0A0V1BBV3_TRISP|nr:Beta-1,4-N-acetylgalactosaminyltransferase bre-4 [Trichinella spiralis]
MSDSKIAHSLNGFFKLAADRVQWSIRILLAVVEMQLCQQSRPGISSAVVKRRSAIINLFSIAIFQIPCGISIKVNVYSRTENDDSSSDESLEEAAALMKRGKKKYFERRSADWKGKNAQLPVEASHVKRVGFKFLLQRRTSIATSPAMLYVSEKAGDCCTLERNVAFKQTANKNEIPPNDGDSDSLEISGAVGLGHLTNCCSKTALTELSIDVRFFRLRPWALIFSTGFWLQTELSASSSHFCSNGFNLHMFLKLSCKASNRHIVVWLNTLPYSVPRARPTSAWVKPSLIRRCLNCLANASKLLTSICPSSPQLISVGCTHEPNSPAANGRQGRRPAYVSTKPNRRVSNGTTVYCLFISTIDDGLEPAIQIVILYKVCFCYVAHFFTVLTALRVKRQTFNRGKLMNVGFLEAMRLHNWTCFVFHDVDLLPENDLNSYSCLDTPRHLSVAVDKFNYRLPYASIFGGVTALTAEQFRRINGFSNEYWGWGGEDDDFYIRVNLKKYMVHRHSEQIGRYKMIKHSSESLNEANPCRHGLLRETSKRWRMDGLNSIRYAILNITEHQLFTRILVDLREVVLRNGTRRICKLLWPRTCGETYEIGRRQIRASYKPPPRGSKHENVKYLCTTNDPVIMPMNLCFRCRRKRAVS